MRLTAALLLPLLARADVFAIVRARALAAYVYPPADSLPALAAAVTASARALNASCFWPDIDYNDKTRAAWGAITHVDRVKDLAVAVSTPGSPVLDDAALLERMHCALDAWIFHYPVFTNPNWWYSWIGEPVLLSTIFLGLGVNRTTPAEQAALVKFSYNATWWVNDYGGGDNLSDMLKVELFRGLASANETAVAEAFSHLFATAAVSHVTTVGAEGVMDDLSYHFHGIQLLSSAYGDGWISTMLQQRGIAAGTRWALGAAGVRVLAQFLVEGDFALTFGRRWDFGTQGRGIDRPGNNFGWSFSGAAMRELAADPGAAPYADGLAAFAAALDGTAPAQVATSKHFWTVDFYAHKRPTWGASFKGHGNNTLWSVVGSECDNSENTQGELLASGAINVYASAEPDNAVESYGAIFPLLNWTMINGVTAEQRAIEPCSMATGDQWKVINTAFVGGASDGRSGAVAHDAAQPRNLTAQRAVFFLDSSVVVFGAALTDASPLPVRTTLLARVLPAGARGAVLLGFANGSTASLADADAPTHFAAGALSYIAAGGIVTLLDATTPVGVQVGNVTGDYNSIGPFHGRVMQRVITAFYDHGVSPRAAAFAYTLAPNVSSADAGATAAAAAGTACATNSVDVQGVAEPAAGLVAAVVWAPGGGALSCGAAFPPAGDALRVVTDRDAIVLVRVNGTHVVVSAAHPALAAAGTTVRVSVNRATAAAAGCAAAGGGTDVSVALPPAGPFMGATSSVACALA